jgi:hypothetical protein
MNIRMITHDALFAALQELYPPCPNGLHNAAHFAQQWARRNQGSPRSREILKYWESYEESGFANDGYARVAVEEMWDEEVTA